MLKTLLALVVIGIAAAAGYGVWYLGSPVTIRQYPVEVEIPRGAGFRAALDQLEKSGVSMRRYEFELLARSMGKVRDIKAGSYEISQPVTPAQLLQKLTRGDVTQGEIRLIEGWTFAQFRAALDASPDLRHDTKGMTDAQVLERLRVSEGHPEGLFFPDTYLFGRGASDTAVLRRAYRAMGRHLKEEWEARDPSVPYRTPYEGLTMASIIEKETGQAGERDMIGGVLVNRLRIGMRLQVDPTIIYGLGASFDGNLKRSHLTEDGPYNTYTRAGLPPTPIAMPGLASVRAAMRPGKTNAMYYVSRNDGSSHFSRTLEEHNRAVAKYQLRGGR
ncbi:MAG TPA: endolytic transglycosylase MltG [Burkholderiales bacterium]|nr:endolytic transglycosylase MltG [Burkholderiales bacterium]